MEGLPFECLFDHLLQPQQLISQSPLLCLHPDYQGLSISEMTFGALMLLFLLFDLILLAALELDVNVLEKVLD